MSPAEFQSNLKKAVSQLRTSDPILKGVIDQIGPCKLAPHTDYYRELVDSVISQQLSVKAAASIVDRFAKLGANKFPSPDEVLSLSADELRAVGLSRAKAAYVKDIAQHIVDGRLDIDVLPQLPNEEIIVELTDIKGIGEWTAHMFLIFSLGRLDVLPTGDLGIRKGVKALYGFDELPTPLMIAAIAERNGWTGGESVASWYIWKSLNNA